MWTTWLERALGRSDNGEPFQRFATTPEREQLVAAVESGTHINILQGRHPYHPFNPDIPPGAPNPPPDPHPLSPRQEILARR